MSKLIEIITIGDEILIGQIVDTNSAWLGEQLSLRGLRVHQISSVSDNLVHITEAMKLASTRADIVIMTGGLGPTKDDITKTAIASVLGCGMRVDQPSYSHIKSMLGARGVEFNASNQAQALIPELSEALKNNNGTAPGMHFRLNNVDFFSLPGVPFEMKALIQEQVIPWLDRNNMCSKSAHKTVVTFGIAESVLSETISQWEDKLPPHLHLAYLPNPRAIRLRLSCYQASESTADEIDAQFQELRTIIRPYFLGYEPASVESNLADMLISREETLSVAESCTGGAISARITAMEGSSGYYQGGACTYSNQAKSAILGVDHNMIEKHGAVSREVAEAMAIGAKERFDSTYAISTTGIAGPGGGSDEKPVGTVWIAISGPWGVESRKMQYGQLRAQNIERSATQALNMLRLKLMDLPDSLQNTSLL